MRTVGYLFVLIAVQGWLTAQTAGEVTGRITDASDAVVEGAIATLTDAATSTVRSSSTTAAGIFNFPSVQPGVYELKIEKPGFRTMTRQDIEVAVQQTVRVDFVLEIGIVTDVIRVSGEAPLLNTEDGTVGTVIDNRRIVELPLNGRNYLQLAALSQNVSFGFNRDLPNGASARQGGSRAEQYISIAGQRNAFNRFTLDGVENTDVNFNTYIILPSIDALQEFKVQTGVYPAEFGREVSQINVSTRSGTNQFHAALFEFLRNDKLDAKSYSFTTVRTPSDPFRWNQYGLVLGGPVLIPKVFNGRNRLFFLSNFEGYRDRKQLRGNYLTPPLPTRSGDFSGVSKLIFDPASRVRTQNSIPAQPFPGNVIPQDRIDPVARRLMEFIPEPNATAAFNYQIGVNRNIDKDQFIQRADWVESSASRWFGRYSQGNEFQVAPDVTVQIPGVNGTKLITNVKQVAISNTRVFSPALVGDFRFGYSRFLNSLGTQSAFVRDVVSELNVPGAARLEPAAWGPPLVVLAPDYMTYGNTLNGPYVLHDHVFQWTGSLSWTRGKHSLRLGAEIRRDRFNESGNSSTRGEFYSDGYATQNPASPNGTGNAFADYLLGVLRSTAAAVSLAGAQFRSTGQYYFVDDQWKLRRNLTLSIGLRYENTPPWFDRTGTIINADLPFLDSTPNVADLSRHPTLVRTGAGDVYENAAVRFNPSIKVARDRRLGERLVTRDNNDFAPRLGMAWRPASRWSVRTGAGMFYSQDTGNPRFDLARNIAGARRETANPDFPNLSFAQPFSTTGTAVLNAPFVLANAYGRRTPYVIQYLLNVEHELGSGTVIEAGYLGSISRKLESLRLFNSPLPAASGSVSSRQPYPELGRIQIADNAATSNYNSLALKITRRQSRGLTYLGNYTWSRSIDTSSAIRSHMGDTQFPENNYCLRCERGLSSFHVAHRFSGSALYDLPFGRGRRWANRGGVGEVLWGGWEISSIVTLQSGFPLNISSGRDQSNTSIVTTSDRPNSTGATAALARGEQDPERFFNTAVFVLQAPGTFGNVGRNTVIGPGIIGWDFSALKQFRIRERQRLQFRWEAFNLPNHPNFGTPDGALVSPTFGKIRDTRTAMREIQFGLKYIF